MDLRLSILWHLVMEAALLVAICSLSDCYDPLDPSGNITVTFDIQEWTTDGYVARVTIQNYYQYRHVDKPGWNIGWAWTKNEIIWKMSGAFATSQGDCSNFKFQTPHSCLPNPTITDLQPDTAPAFMSVGCCHSGLLSAWGVNPFRSFSSFEMTVGNVNQNSTVHAPANLTLLAPGPGYTCSPVLETEPTKSSDMGGKRQVQAYKTWKSTCTYSSFLANKTPVCCVSLSTFYNSIVTTCPMCSCGCRESGKSREEGQTTVPCISGGEVSSLASASDFDIVQCTDHMCPVRVHWHVKNNYMGYWRVKLTISNYNYNRNYSNWNVLVQHPGFSQKSITYSFNSTTLPTVGIEDKVALFWGLEYYNTELLQAEEQIGSVTTEILLKKDPDTFTLRNGWALPRRIYFNGEECEMPLPDDFPMLPNVGYQQRPSHHRFLQLVLIIFLF